MELSFTENPPRTGQHSLCGIVAELSSLDALREERMQTRNAIPKRLARQFASSLQVLKVAVHVIERYAARVLMASFGSWERMKFLTSWWRFGCRDIRAEADPASSQTTGCKDFGGAGTGPGKERNIGNQNPEYWESLSMRAFPASDMCLIFNSTDEVQVMSKKTWPVLRQRNVPDCAASFRPGKMKQSRRLLPLKFPTRGADPARKVSRTDRSIFAGID
jgi:hypothetical protein